MFSFVLAPEHERLRQIWLVGCGAMGGALLGRWIESGLPASAVTVVDPNPSGLPQGFSGHVVPDAISACGPSPDPSLVVLGVKPQMVAQLAPGLGRLLRPPPLVVSMMAGVRIDTLAGHFQGAPIVRIMPNTPARIGRGVTAALARNASDSDLAAARWLIDAVGASVWLDDETQFDAVTAVSGSGPAYVFRFIEALTAAAEGAGLPPAIAAELAIETVAGAAELARQSAQSPAELRQQVTSPNGTTQAGLAMLDGDGLLTSLLRSTVRAAAERSRVLAEAAAAPQAGAGPQAAPQAGAGPAPARLAAKAV